MEKPLKILLVEDEVITAMVFINKLNRIGYSVVRHVTKGEDAIISARQDHPDVIIMDIRLAGEMDGIDAATAIKAETDIEVIFVTGYDDKDIRERAGKTKSRGYLTKPVDIIKIKSIFEDIARERDVNP